MKYINVKFSISLHNHIILIIATMSKGNFFIQTDLCMGSRGLFICSANDRVADALRRIDGAKLKIEFGRRDVPVKTGFEGCDVTTGWTGRRDGRFEPQPRNSWELVHDDNVIELEQTIGCTLPQLYKTVSSTLEHAFREIDSTSPFYVDSHKRGEMLKKAGDQGNFLHITPHSDFMGGATMYYGVFNNLPRPCSARVIYMLTYF